jgi:hypothetical protein
MDPRSPGDPAPKRRSLLSPRLSRRAGWLMVVLGAFLIGQSLASGAWSAQQRLLGVLAAADGMILFFSARAGFYLAVLALSLYLGQESYREWRNGFALLNLFLFVRLILAGGILLLAWGGKRAEAPVSGPTR